MVATSFIPYTFLALFLHKTCMYMSKDKIIADYVVPMFYNIAYLTALPVVIYIQAFPQEVIAKHVMSALIGWYSFDIANLINSSYASRNVYIVHHIVSLNLLLLHYLDVLPLSNGITFLTLFEASNLFLLPYQLCLHKGWTRARYFLTKPMVFMYVPLRVFAIPLCSLTYYNCFHDLDIFSQVLCGILFGMLNFFSLFYGIVIGYKYSLYLKKSIAK